MGAAAAANGTRPSRTEARAPRHLSPLDAAFLYFERPHQLMAVGCLAEIEGEVDHDRFVDVVAERLCAIPLYRSLPVRSPLDLGRPSWVEDERFDVRRHVRYLAVPSPGGDRELRGLVDHLFAEPLDPNHPLWDVTLIAGLERGRSAMLWKMHHCMIDGVSGAQVLNLVTDVAPGATPSAPLLPSQVESRGDRAARGPVRGWFDAAARLFDPSAALALARDVATAAGAVAELVRDPTVPLPFNGPLTDRRRLAWASVSLDDVLAIRGAAGCKVNDVVLAVIGDALHRYLEGRGFATHEARLRAVVPVSLRSEGDRLSLGNLVTAMLPAIPIGPLTPLERLRRVAEEMRARKEQGQARAAALLVSAAGALPPVLEAAFGRFAPEGLVANTVVTNVPGPREERCVLGRRVLDVHPIAPLFQGMGLEFAIMSYGGRLCISTVADAALVPDPERIAEAVSAAVSDLRQALPGGVSAIAKPTPKAACVADLMAPDVVTASPGDTLLAAHELMRQRRIRHLPVLDEARRVVGIVTHRDLVAAQASSLDPTRAGARLRGLARARIAEIMETHVSTASAGEPASEAGRRMMRHKIGCLPVVGQTGDLVGIVTAEDYLRWATERMEAPGVSAAARPAHEGRAEGRSEARGA